MKQRFKRNGILVLNSTRDRLSQVDDIRRKLKIAFMTGLENHVLADQYLGEWC